MVTISVLYPKTESSHFDHQYYTGKHIPLVRSLWTGMGLERVELLRGTGTLEGVPPAYELIGTLTFASIEQIQAALAKGAEVLADIPNFTDVQPVIQLNQPVTA